VRIADTFTLLLQFLDLLFAKQSFRGLSCHDLPGYSSGSKIWKKIQNFISFARRAGNNASFIER
jgi:hypothetical protein